MRNLRNTLRFGWPYLRRYWTRLACGIVLGILFGFCGALILGASRTIFERLDPDPDPAQPELRAGAADANIANAASFQQWRQTADVWRRKIQEGIDPWLPIAGRPLDARQVMGLLLLLPLLFALRGFLGYFSSYCMGWVSERVVNDLRVDVLVKLNSLSLDYFNRSTMGDLLTRINGDTAALQRGLNLGFSDLIKEPVTVLGVFAYLFFMDWRLTLFVMIFLPTCVVPIAILGRKARRASKAGVDATISQSSLAVEVLSSIRIVKAFGLEKEQIERFRQYSRQLVHHGMKGIQAKELVNPIIETLSALGLGVLIVFIFWTQRSLPEMIVFLGGVIAVYTPIKKLAGLHVLFQQTSVGVDRLEQLLSEQPSVKEPAKPVALADFKAELRFDDVSFSYGDQEVLRAINLTIPRGHKLGVAGESGSGKSTLVNLLFRFYDPTRGTVRFDGRDLREVSLHDLRRQMALVSQEIVLFDLTVAENIACGRPGATRVEIENAARAANAHEFILQLPQGYDTRIGERGVTLSGGQRQRLAIARAFVRNAPILVLDEATAALDARSEAEVQKGIEALEQNRTVLCVAHRLSTLANMDRIIVLERGGIVEEGTFEELLDRNGIFAAMARRQGILTLAR
ncbi:MAG: ABC transporter ATP-binding protein [Verrucomicrobiota bacterium]